MATTTQPRSDEAIREDVLLELKWDPKIKSTDIGVAVKNGVVTLAGFVSTFWELDAAEKAAKRVYGVRAVAILKSSYFGSEPIRRSVAMRFGRWRAMSVSPAIKSK